MDGYNYEVARIEYIRHSKEPLRAVGEQSGNQHQSFFGYSRLLDISEPCPFCGYIEPWKEISHEHDKIKELSPEHFPIVFEEWEEADKWALNYIKNIADNNIEHNKEEALNNFKLANAETAELRHLKESIPERTEYIALKDKLFEIRTSLPKLRGKNKRSAKKLFEETENSLKAAEKALSERNQDIDMRICKASASAEKALCELHGYQKEPSVYMKSHSKAYILRPDIRE